MERFWTYRLDHIVFWTATIGFHMYTRLDLAGVAGWDHFLLEVFVRNGLLALLIYTNLLILIPRFAQQGKVLVYALLLFSGLGIYVLLKNAHDAYLYGYVLNIPGRADLFYNIYYNFSIAFFYLAFSIALHLSKAWYFQREMLLKMEMEKLHAELEYLKAQINPHFVFNSINAIYFQIDKQNEAARNSLAGFSEMLRYQLYECNGDFIPVEKEIRYLENYVSLQKIRKDENYLITFSKADGLGGFVIAPFLLIPFVENAFKHVSHLPGKNEIRIELTRSNDHFRCLVVNTKEKCNTHSGREGIGLKNVKRRLELLYKDSHHLQLEDRQDTFLVDLSLKIREFPGTQLYSE